MLWMGTEMFSSTIPDLFYILVMFIQTLIHVWHDKNYDIVLSNIHVYVYKTVWIVCKLWK